MVFDTITVTESTGVTEYVCEKIGFTSEDEAYEHFDKEIKPSLAEFLREEGYEVPDGETGEAGSGEVAG